MFQLRSTKDGMSVYVRWGDAVAKFNFYHTFVRTMGMTNTIEHLKKYVLFMDIDDMTYQEVCNLLRRLDTFVKRIDMAYEVEPMGIGRCMIFKTRKDNLHWHVIDPSIYELFEIINMLYVAEPNDIKYLACGLRQCGPDKGGWTLRIDKKDNRDHMIKFHKYFDLGEHRRPVSGAHIDFMKAMHGINYPVWDVSVTPTNLEIDKYYTTNVVKNDE